MKRYAASILAAIAALMGVTLLASSAQAQQAAYPVPSLTLHLSLQSVVSGHTFVGTARADIKCITLTETWNGQSATATGSVVTHHFKAPIVTKPTIIPVHAVCTYTTIVGAAGAALAVTTHSVSASANVTVLPVSHTHPGGVTLPNTGGPSIVWFIVGAAALLLGAIAVFFGRRRRHDEVAH